MDDITLVKVAMAKALIKQRLRDKGEKISHYAAREITRAAKEYTKESYQKIEAEFHKVFIKEMENDGR